MFQGHADDVLGATVYDTDGGKIGRVKQVYLDDKTDRPEWVTVHTGLFGTKESFLPLVQARLEGDRLVVPIAKDAVKDSPRVDPDGGSLSAEEEAALYRHYGLQQEGAAGIDDDRERAQTDPVPDVSQPATAADQSATPGPAGTGSTAAQPPAPAGLRLRRHVVIEQQQISVPVTREEYVVEPDPDAGPADPHNDEQR